MLTMEIFVILGYVFGIIGFIGTIAGAVIMVRATATKTTIQSQKELITTLLAGKEEQKEQIIDLQHKYNDATSGIAGLQGQIDVLKNIPLKEISVDMRAIVTEMSSISQNQKDIVHLLKTNGFHKKA